MHDPVKTSLSWFLSFIDESDWNERKRKIKTYFETPDIPISDSNIPLSEKRGLFLEDQFAWYLYLADSFLNNPNEYDLAQGAKIIPVLTTLGREMSLLKEIDGINEKVKFMATAGRKNADSGLFEILVGLAYKRNGWSKVCLLPATPTVKTPDLLVENEKHKYFIECKRLCTQSEYSFQERQKWLVMCDPLLEYLADRMRAFLFEITFHVELQTLDDSFIENELIPKVDLIVEQGVVINNEIWTVNVKYIDLDRISFELQKTNVKAASPSLIKLISGEYRRDKGFTIIIRGNFCSTNNKYIDEITFAAGIHWECDAKASYIKKARDIRRHLSEALRQVPREEPSIIHIGLDTIDGQNVEKLRYDKILQTIFRFNTLGINLQWIFCHLFDPHVPIDKNWDFGETVHYFQKEHSLLKNPLPKMLLVVPE